MVMKYIERPLTICRRKWDMRQWVLVAGWNPLCVFMHRQSYARFAVEEYDETAQHQSADGGSDDDGAAGNQPQRNPCGSAQV
jgi:hypothetical protein